MASALNANQALQKQLKKVGEQIDKFMKDNEKHIASITQLRVNPSTHQPFLPMLFPAVLANVLPHCLHATTMHVLIDAASLPDTTTALVAPAKSLSNAEHSIWKNHTEQDTAMQTAQSCRC